MILYLEKAKDCGTPFLLRFDEEVIWIFIESKAGRFWENWILRTIMAFSWISRWIKRSTCVSNKYLSSIISLTKRSFNTLPYFFGFMITPINFISTSSSLNMLFKFYEILIIKNYWNYFFYGRKMKWNFDRKNFMGF